MLARLLRRVTATGRAVVQVLHHRLEAATKPGPPALITGAVTDLVRSKSALIAENALPRQQLLVLRRGVKRPRCAPADRALLVLLANRLPTWRSALLLVQPTTLPRWHRQLFRRYWCRKSPAGASAHRPKIPADPSC